MKSEEVKKTQGKEDSDVPKGKEVKGEGADKKQVEISSGDIKLGI